jgi:hypothetical protein
LDQGGNLAALIGLDHRYYFYNRSAGGVWGIEADFLDPGRSLSEAPSFCLAIAIAWERDKISAVWLLKHFEAGFPGRAFNTTTQMES